MDTLNLIVDIAGSFALAWAAVKLINAIDYVPQDEE